MAQQKLHFFSRLFLAALLMLDLSVLAGCGDIPYAKSTVGRNSEVAETPNKSETVRGEDDPPVVTLELGSALHEHRLSGGDELPANIIIPTTNLNAVPVTAALQAVLAGTDVSLSWDTGALGDRLVTVMNLSGPLPKVVDHICSAAKVFCSYRRGSLELTDKETFVVGLPPVPKTVTASTSSSSSGASISGAGTNSMVEAIDQLINSKVQVDEQGGNMIYTADVEGSERVDRYLEQLRNGRPLVVLQLYIWEVTLDREYAAGINWNYLKLEDIGPGYSKLALDAAASTFTSLQGTSGSATLGATTAGRINTSALLSFLSTQGQVQTISNPQVTFVSGSNAQLKVGGKLRYISQVGQLVSATNTSGTTNPSSNTGVGTNTVSTDSIDTGLEVNAAGAYENGVVMATLDLSLTNLVSLNPTNSGGGTIDLPETSDEKINTVIRVRPGDNLIMAGLVTSKDNNTRQGVPLASDATIPTFGDNQAENHELVVVVKPSVILFSDHGAVEEARRKEEAKPLPAAMLIDRSGAKPIEMPGAQSSLTAPAATVAPVAVAQPNMPTPPLPSPNAKPELMSAALPMPAPTSPIPLSASEDGAPVDKRMMQRGFSHAFDDMLQPAPSSLTANGETKP